LSFLRGLGSPINLGESFTAKDLKEFRFSLHILIILLTIALRNSLLYTIQTNILAIILIIKHTNNY